MSEWKIRFGTAGTSDSFAAQGGKTSLDIPEYTAKMGLNAFEYQCGHGVRLGLDKAAKMAALAAPKDILFSVHAPYYISMSSLEEDKRLNSVNYLLQSAAVCRALGGQRVIFHSGSCGKQSREAALEKALDTLRRAQTALDEAGFSDITLCPETMGKIGQLGTLDEVLEELRVQGVSSLADVKYAVLETSGQLSVLLRANVQPATPKQMGLKVDDDVFLPFIIIDNGRLMGKNLQKMGLDDKWLQKQLKAHKAHRVQDVFLMTVDRGGSVVLAKKESVK